MKIKYFKCIKKRFKTTSQKSQETYENNECLSQFLNTILKRFLTHFLRISIKIALKH